MRPLRQPYWILAFDPEDVCTWKDVRLAYAIDDLWNMPGCPPSMQAHWMACDDQYSFRWYLSDSLIRMLDQADVSWREFVIGRSDEIPAEARPYLPVRLRPALEEEQRTVLSP